MNWINKIVDAPKLVRRLWIILWITLFIFTIAKLCFNLWYPIVVRNETIINIGNFIDSHVYIRYIIYGFLYVINGNIVYLTSTKKSKYKKFIYLLLVTLGYLTIYFIKNFNNGIGCILEVLILIPTIFINLRNNTFSIISKKGKLIKFLNIILPFVVYLLLNLWQTNIIFIRGIDKIISQLPVIINLALQIDYYIFLIITWIGVNYFMGISGLGWWWGKSTTELKAIKEAELAKSNPDTKILADIEKELAKRNEIKN